jgi:hypothetical protein
MIRQHQTSKTQWKLDVCFKPINRPKPVSPQPSTASANGAGLSPGLTTNREEQQSDSSSE